MSTLENWAWVASLIISALSLVVAGLSYRVANRSQERSDEVDARDRRRGVKLTMSKVAFKFEKLDQRIDALPAKWAAMMNFRGLLRSGAHEVEKLAVAELKREHDEALRKFHKFVEDLESLDSLSGDRLEKWIVNVDFLDRTVDLVVQGVNDHERRVDEMMAEHQR
ncbi:hypothetical protein HKCCE3408_05145 [Rhodobacterales bacterium HKCCE3408]|nr:hypothetical protein [Rhodobacterales bacterium HKCCE3408]